MASLFQSEEKDKALRRGVLEFLANVTCNSRATTSLVLKSSLLSWIELQIRLPAEEEALAWIRIVENILAVLDSAKIEQSTHGEWREMLGRCISRVLYSPTCTDGVFCEAVPVVLRLSLLPGPQIAGIDGLITRCLTLLKVIEGNVTILTAPLSLRADTIKRVLPHRAHDLFVAPPSCATQDWGVCVEALWRVTMTRQKKCPEWEELTPRLLIWRSLVGEDGSKIGEWARKEVVVSIKFG